MNMVEIIGNQHLRILALEETVGQLQTEVSLSKERLLSLGRPAIELLDSVRKPDKPFEAHHLALSLALHKVGLMSDGKAKLKEAVDAVGT